MRNPTPLSREWLQLSPPVLGYWCPTCALSSAMMVPWMQSATRKPTSGSTQPELIHVLYLRVLYCENECPPRWMTNEDT